MWKANETSECCSSSWIVHWWTRSEHCVRIVSQWSQCNSSWRNARRESARESLLVSKRKDINYDSNFERNVVSSQEGTLDSQRLETCKCPSEQGFLDCTNWRLWNFKGLGNERILNLERRIHYKIYFTFFPSSPSDYKQFNDSGNSWERNSWLHGTWSDQGREHWFSSWCVLIWNDDVGSDDVGETIQKIWR